MAQRYTSIFGDQIDSSVAGAALVKNTTDDFSHKFDVNVDDSTVEVEGIGNALQVKDDGITAAKLNADTAGAGLVQDVDGSLKVNVDDSTIEIATDVLQVKDEGITEAKLDISNAPTDGYYLQYTTANGLTWAAVTDTGLIASDFVFNEIPSGTINSLNTTFTLANTPEAGTVTVYLNGMFQGPGASEDYTISGSTITFNKAPRTNSRLYVNYIKS